MLFARLAFRIARVLPLSLSVVEYSSSPIFLRLSFSLRGTPLPILLPQPLFSLSLFCQRIIGERRVLSSNDQTLDARVSPLFYSELKERAMLSLNKTSSIVKGAALFDDPRTIAANPIAFVIDQTFAGLRPSFVGGSSLYNLQFTSSSASLISSSLCILIVISCSLSRNQIFIFLHLILFFNQLHSRI